VTLSTFGVVVLPALMSLMKSFLTRLASVHAAASVLKFSTDPRHFFFFRWRPSTV
jgi:hypothetical protein